MDVQFAVHNRNLIVSIHGDIDHHSSALLREKIDKELKKTEAKNIVFDFTRVGFMDSSGIGMIIGRYKAAQEKGGTVAVAALSGDLSRLFTMSGLHKIIKQYKDADEASARIG